MTYSLFLTLLMLVTLVVNGAYDPFHSQNPRCSFAATRVANLMCEADGINTRLLNTDMLNDPFSPEPLTPFNFLMAKSHVVISSLGEFVQETSTLENGGSELNTL